MEFNIQSNNKTSHEASTYSIASSKYRCQPCNRIFSALKLEGSLITCPRCNTPASEQISESNSNRQNQNQSQQRPHQPGQSGSAFIFFTPVFTFRFFEQADPSAQTQQEAQAQQEQSRPHPFAGFDPFSLFGFGRSYEDIIEEFIRNDPNHHGPAPASKESIAKLEEHNYCGAHGEKACSVCQDDYNEGEKIVKLPCGHDYHKECVTKWLEMHNSCPVCRKPLQA